MIIVCNCVNSRKSTSLKTVYAQQRRYLLNINRNIYPRKAFQQDLEAFLYSSMQDEFLIVVALDANENTKMGSIARTFLSLGLIDSISTITSATPPGSYIRGSHQINSIWVSLDLSVKAASFCLFNFGVGDHRMVIVDLDKSSLFRSSSTTLLFLKLRRLISSNSLSVTSYLSYSKEKINEHKIIPKLNKLVSEWDQLSLIEREQSLNKIDGQLHQIFIKAEK